MCFSMPYKTSLYYGLLAKPVGQALNESEEQCVSSSAWQGLCWCKQQKALPSKSCWLSFKGIYSSIEQSEVNAHTPARTSSPRDDFCGLTFSLHSRGPSWLPLDNAFPPSFTFFFFRFPPSALASFLCQRTGMSISESGRFSSQGKLWLEAEIVANKQLRWIQCLHTPSTNTPISVQALITSHLDYCHSSQLGTDSRPSLHSSILFTCAKLMLWIYCCHREISLLKIT